MRRMNDEVKSLKDAIPRALQGAREGNENRLRELGSEIRSLKLLLGNRLGGGSGGTSSPTAGKPVGSALPGASRPVEEPSTAPTAGTNGVAAAPADQNLQAQPATVQSGSSTPSPLRQLGKSATIPAWQMAASNKPKNDSPPKATSPADVNPSGEANGQQQQSGSSS